MAIVNRPADTMSWGRYFRFEQGVVAIDRARGVESAVSEAADRPVLPHGMGRSYGDVCLVEGGVSISAAGLRKILAFDRDSGVLSCEAGCTIGQLLEVIVPRGWFVPVTPGTRYVTVGGAVANDVHGKNHHCAGTFGRHVLAMDIWRSDIGVHSIRPEDPLFRATVGGLGLTGLILSVTLQCIPVESAFIEKQSVRIRGVGEFFELSEESDGGYNYTVAWIDCLAPTRWLGRGQFYRGNHARDGGLELKRKRRLAIPFELPVSAINRASIWSFNALYRSRQRRRTKDSVVGYDSFFYPLDGVEHWNRLYGRWGLFQFQSVTPVGEERAVTKLLQTVSASGTGSPLVVLKAFGSIESPGLLSFPMHGYTLCVDFPNLGPRVLKLLRVLEDITMDAGGRIYPAKDAVMSRSAFERGFPRFGEFSQFIDPAFSSSFLSRVS
jgi:FAD/FMN-containing dehydrogenase